jgi:hypothetical protein
MYKVDKSWFGFLSRPEIESQIYSHLLCTWWYKKSRSGFQSFLWRPGMWIMATGFWNCNMVRNSCLSANSKVKQCAMERALIVTWAFRVPTIYGMPQNCLSRTLYTQQVWDVSHCHLATAKLNPQFEKTKNNHLRLLDMPWLYLCPLDFTKLNTALCTILHSCASVLQWTTHIHVLLHNQNKPIFMLFCKENNSNLVPRRYNNYFPIATYYNIFFFKTKTSIDIWPNLAIQPHECWVGLCFDSREVQWGCLIFCLVHIF